MEPYEFNLIKARNSSTIGMVLYFEEKFYIKNFNLYKIHLRDIQLKFKLHTHTSLPKLSYAKHFEIPAMSEKAIEVKVKLALYNKMDSRVDLCINGLIMDLFSSLKGIFTFGHPLWIFDKFVEIREIQYINCHAKNFNNSVFLDVKV